MPRQISDIKKFIEYARRKDARAVRIKKTLKSSDKSSARKTQTKFKLRCSRLLYTLVLEDTEKADKLKQSLPPGLTVEEVSAPKKK
ncbi:hypothetical protein M0805_002631 [Coniferiporia weirii]|nr:hypothetical protein M0805_002631 [Coniferiporia weirii]